MNTIKIYLLRFVHGLFALYFILCLIYLYYAAISSHIDGLLAVAIVSLVIEGFSVLVLNKGNCPFIHIQKKIGDHKPFFELFFKPSNAKQAIPLFAKITWFAVALLIIRLLYNYLN